MMTAAKVYDGDLTAVATTAIVENLGAAAEPIAQSSLRSLLRALRRAHDSEVIVVDLRRGQTWWDTRLFILIAGAARRNRPQVVAFIGDRNGRTGVFLGWATPSRLLEMHLAAEPAFGAPYASALARTLQWQIGTPPADPPGTAKYVILPWTNTALSLPPVEGDTADPEFAMELFLQQALEGPGAVIAPRHVSVQRLLALYEPELITDEVEAAAPDRVWADLLVTGHRRYFAVTTAGTFKYLVSRDALMGAMLARLATNDDQGTTPPNSGRQGN